MYALSTSMNLGKFAARLVCSSSIEPESSTTKRMSILVQPWPPPPVPPLAPPPVPLPAPLPLLPLPPVPPAPPPWPAWSTPHPPRSSAAIIRARFMLHPRAVVPAAVCDPTLAEWDTPSTHESGASTFRRPAEATDDEKVQGGDPRDGRRRQGARPRFRVAR